jgi:DNA polymerase III subunit epsilon
LGVDVGAWGDGFAVIDFETTGFGAYRADRVVEIGVVCIDPAGEIVDEWTTLVNPERDVSAGFVHGITGRDVYGAPRFADVAGLLAHTLRGRVLAAHNLAFDAQFLAAEYARLGHDLALDGGTGICTMSLAGAYLPVSRRNLGACCACCDIPLRDHHSALADARAAASLLCYYIGCDDGFDARWAQRLQASLAVEWPELGVATSCLLPRGRRTEHATQSYIGRLAARLPVSGRSGLVESYLEVLDRALIDRVLTLHEMDELLELATSLGLSREQTDAAHSDYVDALVRLAWTDGVVTDEELDDLVVVADLLGVSDDDLARKMRAQQTSAGEGPRAGEDGEWAPGRRLGTFRLEPGDKVVFTGEFGVVSREGAIVDAERAGLRVMSSVSRKTKLLVAGDPDSISSKARKARECGVPIVEYGAYLKLRRGLC